MSAAHTKGPWFVLSESGCAFQIADNANPNFANILCTRFAWEEKADEMQANAHLMASAPDLLVALQDLADDMSERFDLDSPSTNPGIKNTIAAARVAIAKALGRAQ